MFVPSAQLLRKRRRRSVSPRMRIIDEHFIDELQTSIRVSHTFKVGPGHSMFPFLPCPLSPKAGAVVLARLEKIDRNETPELVNVRRCVLQEEDLSGVVFGNRRYSSKATHDQMETPATCSPWVVSAIWSRASTQEQQLLAAGRALGE